ncbi:MAG: UPF0223 family protein [Bacilli bacterium]|jgi:uncharacterized protein YktA (UPF0223 family)|nr:UPF0223 family protein [Bacilli bacterium]MDY0063669.1 UPF0223 family protein [Bacilli bacterium]
MEKEIKIDYSIYRVEEIVQINSFWTLLASNRYQKMAKDELISRYRTYQNIIHNKALEKEYDRMFQSMYQRSIYKIMKEWMKG